MKKLRKIVSAILLTAMVAFAAGCTPEDDPTNNGGNNNGGDYNGGNVTPEVPTIPTGAVDGKFSINDQGGKVYFSQGNLQYQASTNTWRFAEHPWDHVMGKYGFGEGTQYGNVAGSDNTLASADYAGWQDLFSWGTSGWSDGVIAYQPYLILTVFHFDEYYLLGDDPNNGLVGQYANADWGIYNAISNGGNQSGLWRTLTKDEWEYVIGSREGNRFCKAQVEGANGIILFPDGWDNTIYSLNGVNMQGVNWDSNVISGTTWKSTLEPAGLVFLPTTGERVARLNGDHWDIRLDLDDNYGDYWSSTPFVNDIGYGAYEFSFNKNYVRLYENGRWRGLAVRLVQDVH